MSHDKLTYMANQIATFFDSQPADTAADGVAGHINDFWDPRMRRALAAILAQDTDALHPLVRAAADRIRFPPAP